MQIWDTAGQERFRTITQSYYKGAMGVVLLYDCTREDSFNNVRNWVRQIETHACGDVQKVLVGNKTDLTDKKVISTEQGHALAKEFNFSFFEASAMTGLNVQETFFHAAKSIKDHQITQMKTAGGPLSSSKGGIKLQRADKENDEVDGKKGKKSKCCK
jgi:Ras-related protein Rab-8A